MFAATGYKLVVNRPVHEWNPARLKRAIDAKFTTTSSCSRTRRFAISAPAVLGPGDEETLHRLYSAIYVNKHQGYNARYTARFFRCMYELGMMRFITIRHQDRIVAFLSMMFDDGAHVVGALLGYDTSLDKKQFPLYRMAVAAVLRDGLERSRLVFLSTGAASFKHNRGTYGVDGARGDYIAICQLIVACPGGVQGVAGRGNEGPRHRTDLI